VWAPALITTVLLTACGAPALDDDQASAARRTCASLRERVAARVLAEAGPLGLPAGDGPVKDEALSPSTLRDDPVAFYVALESALTDSGLGLGDEPSPLSPASRLVDACRSLDP
jgi:hypothetical protein